MRRFPSSVTAMALVPDSLQHRAAAFLQNFGVTFEAMLRRAEIAIGAIHSYISSAPEKIALLVNRWSGPRAGKARMLQFSDLSAVETEKAEPNEEAILANRRNLVVQQALHVEKLQASAGLSLDAADYTLLRMRLELAEIAPGLVTGLPDQLLTQDHASAGSPVPLHSYRSTMPDHRNLEAWRAY